MNWSHVTVFGGVGLSIGLSLVLSLFVVLPRKERTAARFPLFLLVVQLLILVARAFTPSGSDTDVLLRICGVFFLASSIARSTFLLLFHFALKNILSGEVPRILRDLIQAGFYAAAFLLTLHTAGVEPGALFTTSALVTAVVGFALQDTLGNLFAGLAIQAQQPFRVGDWIQWDETEDGIGIVEEMNWRAVKVATLENVEMTVPNSTLAKSALRNYTMPTPEARLKLYSYAPYSLSPETVRAAYLEALEQIDGVLRTPAPLVVVHEFTERGVCYEVRYFIQDFGQRIEIAGEVQMRLWYVMKRLGADIPVPQRAVQLHEVTKATRAQEVEQQVDNREEALRRVDFLDALPRKSLHQLAELTSRRLFAPREPIIREGDHGDELFIILRGEVCIEIATSGRKKELQRLNEGQFFGEMSLMTGAMRRASVTAVTEVDLMVISKTAFQPVLEDTPELAVTISNVLAEREAVLTDAQDPMSAAGQIAAPSNRALLRRIKQFFSLGQDDS